LEAQALTDCFGNDSPRKEEKIAISVVGGYGHLQDLFKQRLKNIKGKGIRVG
jgi:hypothetical protein